MTKKEMFVLKEPRQRDGGQKGETKTVWNRLGVMFKNEGSKEGAESYDILFDAHPIGDRVKAFIAETNAEEKAKAGA
jgi:hypothetical protein